YIVGTCPRCQSEGAYGDQCEKCGSTLSPDELINPTSKLSGAVPVKRETKHWYLPLDKYDSFLREWILEGHKEWKSNVYGQCKSWLDTGLLPRAVSRDLDWGIPVPVEGAEGKVLYVWFDAPIGYISATKDLTPDWEKYWKSEDTKMVHFIGKDNIVFHCIVFPSMLKAHGEYILPENVPANEFLNLEGDKISTSKNWAVWLHEYLDEFPGKEDVLRYVLCANAPETKDNDFTWKDYQARNNNELVAILGNFVNRALVLTKKYYNGAVPERGELTEYDCATIEELSGIKASLEANIESYRFREALKDAMNVARIGNKYLADTEPWKVVKTDPERVKTILNIALQITANLTIAIEPFMPFSAEKILKMLQMEKFGWDNLGSMELVKAGHIIGEPQLLFEKIEDEVIEKQLKRLEDIKKANAAAAAAEHVTEQKAECTFDDFQKMDIRVSTILEAEKVAKTKKLLKLTVDTGIDKRTIVSGIAEHFTCEELIGRQVLVLVNLAPREMRGIVSQGMILMAEDASGKLELLSPENKTNNGAMVG
ncbi:MAG: methionine--tRNA ligase, partial [Alistipes sp.]|nr:methionine--tRNA ligase [Alistipes sp.]